MERSMLIEHLVAVSDETKIAGRWMKICQLGAGNDGTRRTV